MPVKVNGPNSRSFLGKIIMSKKNILLIDDNSMLVRSLERPLAHQYNITVAADADEAISFLNEIEKKFDLVISNIHAPEIDKAYFYTDVLKKCPHLENRIIFITGRDR